jgi:hypothetical protein
MRTFQIRNNDGKLIAFEIENLLVGRQRATKIVEQIPNILITKKPKRFLSWCREEVFCEFQLNGIDFEIAEPFGDNSRYWISGKNSGWCPELEVIEHAFMNA